MTQAEPTQEGISEHTAQLEALHQVGLELAAELDLDSLLHSIVSRAMELLDGDGGGLYLYRPDRDVLEWVVGIGPGAPPNGSALHRGEGLSGKIWETGKPLLVNDYQRWKKRAPIYNDLPVAAIAGVPIQWGEELLGVLNISAKNPGSFSSDNIELLGLFATQAAIAIRNARLFREGERRITQLAIINEIGRAISSALEWGELLETVHQQVSRLFDTTNFYIATYQENRDEWTTVLRREHGILQPSATYKVGAGFTGHIIRNRKSLLFRSSRENIAFKKSLGLKSLGELARSWLGVPLVAADKVVGVMAIQNYEQENLYDEDDLALFTTIAAQVAIAMENQRLLEETRHRAQELEVINEVGRAITTVLDVDAVLRRIVDTTKERFGQYFVGIALLEGDRLVFQDGSTVGNTDVRLTRGQLVGTLQSTTSLISEAARTGKPVLVNNVLDDQRYLAAPELLDTRSELDMPIDVKGHVIGVLGMQSERPFAYDQADAALLQSLASQAGVAIENARLYEEAQRELAERKRAESKVQRALKELERSNTELEQFAYVASHDLQEPLRKVQACGDRLSVKYAHALDERGRDYMERMTGAAHRMQAMINDLLAFSRVTTRAKPFISVDLGEITREAVSDLEIRVQQTGGHVEIGNLPTIEADRMQMCQLFTNLIGNALKFHRDGIAPHVKIHGDFLDEDTDPEVTSSLKEPWIEREKSCRIVVEDNGIGFDEKFLQRIFQPFQRLHGRGEYEGSGIGLAICHKIVVRHRGSITAESTPGRGAIFMVTLPVKQSMEGDNS